VSFGTYEALDTTHTRFAPSADVDLADPTSTDP